MTGCYIVPRKLSTRCRDPCRHDSKTLGRRPKPRQGASSLDPFFIFFVYAPRGANKKNGMGVRGTGSPAGVGRAHGFCV
jgi:hypothetical protein